MTDIDARVRHITEVLGQLAEDTSVPRNIRRGANEAKELIARGPGEFDVRVAGAISKLDELANDPNLPSHGYTEILRVLPELEALLRDLNSRPQAKAK